MGSYSKMVKPIGSFSFIITLLSLMFQKSHTANVETNEIEYQTNFGNQYEFEQSQYDPPSWVSSVTDLTDKQDELDMSIILPIVVLVDLVLELWLMWIR